MRTRNGERDTRSSASFPRANVQTICASAVARLCPASIVKGEMLRRANRARANPEPQKNAAAVSAAYIASREFALFKAISP